MDILREHSFCISGDNLLYDRASAFSVFAFIRGSRRSRSQCVRLVECEASLLKKHRLTRKEYAYIKENLEEAKGKIIRLRRALFRSKSIQMLKQNAEILRITRRIYLLTKQEPKRFYQAERFYYQTLDSVVELTEKYALLSSQPRKNKDLSMSLSETRMTLAELSRRLEEDLHELMKEDIDDLHFELDMAKHSLRK